MRAIFSKSVYFPKWQDISRNIMLQLDPPLQMKMQNCSPSAADVFPSVTGNVNTDAGNYPA